MKATIEVRGRGQISIPEAIRKALNLREGDIIEIDVQKVEIKQNDDDEGAKSWNDFDLNQKKKQKIYPMSTKE